MNSIIKVQGKIVTDPSTQNAMHDILFLVMVDYDTNAAFGQYSTVFAMQFVSFQHVFAFHAVRGTFAKCISNMAEALKILK